jgi:hypothetical protein
MAMLESLTPNKWYPDYKGRNRSYKARYPSPQSILRRSVDCEDYKFISEMPNTEGIRAAVIMPPGVPFRHLLNEPWCLVFHYTEWNMIIASTYDNIRWIDLAKATGCIAWQVGHSKTNTYKWTPPQMDEHNMKVRQPGPLKMNRPDDYIYSPRAQVKDYDKESLIQDLKIGLVNHTELGYRYGLTRTTVLKIAHDAGIRQRGPAHGQSK